MKYFTALADATFARAAFCAAGLDLDALRSAGSVDAIKSAISAAKPSVDVEAVLASAKADNDELTSKLAAAEAFKAKAEQLDGIAATLASAGISAESPDKLKEALDARVAQAAVATVAKAGHPGLPEEIVAEPAAAKNGKQSIPRAAFNALIPSEQLKSVRAGVIITD